MILQKYTGAKNTLLLMLILALGGSSVQLYADQEATQLNTTIQPSDLNLEEQEPELPFWRKFVHWYFAVGNMMNVSAQLGFREFYPDQAAKNLFGAQDTLSNEAKVLAYDIFKQQEIDPETMTILNGRLNGNIGVAVGDKTIVLDEQAMKDYTPEEIQFVIGHELAHLKNKDILKMGIVACAAPFVAHFGLKAWDAGVASVLSGIKHTLNISKGSKTDQVLTKIKNINHWLSTFCITKAAVAWQLFAAYSRYLEKQADLTALQHLKTSAGAEQFFKRAQEELKSQRDINFGTRMLITPEGDLRTDVLHPSLSKRIAYSQEYAHAA